VTEPAITAAGDGGFYLRFGDAIEEQTFARVQAAVAALDAAHAPGLVDVMPGYASVLVLFDPATTRPEDARASIVRALAAAVASASATPARTIELPVLYHPRVAPDLEAVAADKGLTPAALAARHAAPLYLCHMLGFRPGFPFLGGLDAGLACARLDTPRLAVPAGSVGIGGRQTGVYPSAGPGGWRIVGRTPLALFDPGRADPFLIHPGDGVRFVPIDEARFAELS
jgi:KipI family sensor histidine kinase inhibitor